MNTTVSSLLCLLLFAIEAKGQAFAFASHQNETESVAYVKGYKLAVAQKVFDALIRGRGYISVQKPTLVINGNEGSIAKCIPEKAQVVLDEKAYDICATFGSDSLNALASILAHELTHYYEKHDWSRKFILNNNDLETSRQLENLDLNDHIRQETEADELGGFLAFSVGYNTYGIMPKYLKKAYAAYELPDDLPGYPNLNERLAIAEGAMARLQELQIVFETATMLTILGNYADAALYHSKILQTYQSREIYNNAGVNAALAGMALFDPNQMPYVLPFELDPKSRLVSLKNTDSEKATRRSILFNLALEHFDKAVQLDELYPPGYLNQACALTMLGRWDDADDCIRKGKRKSSNPQITSDFLVLEGIIAALQEDRQKALSLWELAQKQGNAWAKVNMTILQDNIQHGANTMIPAKGLEEIEQYRLTDFLLKPQPDRTVEVVEKVYCGFSQLKQSRLFVHYANKGKDYVLVQETQTNYTGRTLRGIGLGAKQEKVVEAYGTAPKNIPILGGSVWVYPENNIFFRFSPQLIVESWGVFRKSTSQ